MECARPRIQAFFSVTIMGIDGKNLHIPENNEIMDTLELAELGKKARVVFHDLSNHLMALTISIGNLEENLTKDGDRLKEYSKKSEIARQQMEYVANLLRSHIKNSNKCLFHPAKEINAVLETFRESISLKKIKLSFQLDHKIYIVGRKRDFSHITSNLISNAIESFERVRSGRKKQISVSLRRVDKKIELSVTDTGCGITPNIANRIFEAKFTTKKSGHGIGLFATKEYVENSFSGKIRFSSSTRGTVFIATIPYQTRNKIKTGNGPPSPVFI